MGVPVIASKAAVIPGVCGDAALYFDANSKDDIPDKIYQMVVDNNLRKVFMNMGFEQVKKI